MNGYFFGVMTVARRLKCMLAYTRDTTPGACSEEGARPHPHRHVAGGTHAAKILVVLVFAGGDGLHEDVEGLGVVEHVVERLEEKERQHVLGGGEEVRAGGGEVGAHGGRAAEAPQRLEHGGVPGAVALEHVKLAVLGGRNGKRTRPRRRLRHRERRREENEQGRLNAVVL